MINKVKARKGDNATEGHDIAVSLQNAINRCTKG